MTNKEILPVDKTQRTMTDGSPVTEDHREINPATGQQKGYVVLSEEERKKGFVRPVRQSYVHVGPLRPKYPLRDLTEEENKRYSQYGYFKYEQYPEDETTLGKYWTQSELNKKGCGATTTMSLPLAETYARDPEFYGATFCTGCGAHHPVGEFIWAGTPIERVGS